MPVPGAEVPGIGCPASRFQGRPGVCFDPWRALCFPSFGLLVKLGSVYSIQYSYVGWAVGATFFQAEIAF